MSACHLDGQSHIALLPVIYTNNQAVHYMHETVVSKYNFYVLQNTYVLKGCPLLAAARQGHDKCIELLLEAGADPEENDDRGYNYIMLATVGKHRYIDAVENML